MNRILILGLVFAFFASFNQVLAQENISNPSEEEEEKKDWKLQSIVGLNLNQFGFVNWAGGGNTAFSASALVTGSANYAKSKVRWDNSLTLAGGFSYIFLGAIDDGLTNPWRKTEDKLALVSLFSYELARNDISAWAFTTKLDFTTQFAPGYQYGLDVDTETEGPTPKYTRDQYVSTFLSPGIFNLSVGGSYLYKDFLTVYFSPLALLARIVSDQVLSSRGSHGVEPNQTAKLEIGANLTGTFEKELLKNFIVKEELSMFIGYGKTTLDEGFVASPTILLTSTTTVKLSVNEWFSALLTLDLIYDHENDKIVLSDSSTGRALQVKNVLSIGISYAIKN